MKGDDGKGLTDIEKAVSLAPKNAVPLATRAKLYEVLGRRGDAVSDYRAVLVLDPAHREAKDALTRLGAASYRSRQRCLLLIGLVPFGKLVGRPSISPYHLDFAPPTISRTFASERLASPS